MSCPIGPDGWTLTVEAYYNPDTVRRFGTDLFGSGLFGDYAATPSGPVVGEWQDWSALVSDCNINRGLREPNVNQQTDELRFALYDPDGSIMRWVGQTSLASPNIGTPVRVSLTTPGATTQVLVTARINQIEERHGAAAREVEFYCLGTKTELRTDLLPVVLPAQTIAERIDFVRSEIGFVEPFEPYPPEFLTVELARDPDIRSGGKLDAYFIIAEAAHSAAYIPFTTADGAIGWESLRVDPVPPPVSATISDCTGNGEDAVSTSQFWNASDLAVLNVVQIWASDLQFSAEAVDASSVQRFGRRSRGFGFPISAANKQKSETQDLCDDLLETFRLRVNRVSSVEFHTLTDPRWFQLVYDVEIGSRWSIERTQPDPGAIPATIIGYDLTVTSAHIEGVFYTTTPYETI